MENVEKKEKEVAVKKSKSQRVTLDESIARMKVLFTNAKIPAILSKLETLGYTEERLNGYVEKVAELETLFQNQKKGYGQKFAQTKRVEEKRAEIDELFKKHLAFCKVLFKNDIQANATLQLAVGRKSAYAAWFQQVSNFYSQLLVNDAFKEKVATINIKEADIKEQQKALAELSALKEEHKKDIGEAQKATEVRDVAFEKLNSDYADLVSYAKILFQDDQTLEMLGIVVKR